MCFIAFYTIASQMMTLMRLLPFLIGRYIKREDNHWECFLLLWNICSVTTAFEVTSDDITYLAWIVEVYLETFKYLYDVPITPKLHYLIHLPEQINL